ncbi:unnamed protein product, partial [Choristocarpus tenellus]
MNAQRAGALGVIVADNGQCGDQFGQLCVYGSAPPPLGYWAALDLPRPWLEVRVPVVLMLERDVARVREEARRARDATTPLTSSSLYDSF